MPAFGKPTKPTSAITLSSRRTQSSIVFEQQIGRVVTLAKKDDPNAIVYDLVNDKENPVYAIRVLSSYSKTFSNNEFEQIWAQAKQQNEEGTVSADYGQLVKGSVGNMESYSRTTTYHGDSDSYWRLTVLNNFMTGQIAILSCWYSNEEDIPIDRILAGIRF